MTTTQSAPADQPALREPWISHPTEDQPTVNLYFFWTQTCPHCRVALPFVQELKQARPWLTVHSHELTADPSHAARYQELATSVGQTAQYVPAFIFCEQMLVGFDSATGTGAALTTALEACYADAQAAAATNTAANTLTEVPEPSQPIQREEAVAQWRAVPGAPDPDAVAPETDAAAIAAETTFALPFLGTVSAQGYSLPVLTVVLAGMDAFNPCAFFVLLFLLSMVIHAQSRLRMAIIGGIFVFFSGALYFVFMAAWLNVFLWLGQLFWITLAAGLLALGFGLLNVKDYFYFKRGPSLSIPAKAQPALFARMRHILQAGSWPALIGSAALLAISANTYELLCTAGFPMVFTRVLTLHELPTPVYYGYLLAYALVYIIPLAAIVAVLTIRFSAHKLREAEGRLLKLLSGVMMLLMGLILVFAPTYMSRVEVAVGLLLGAIVITWLIHRWRPPITDAPKGTPLTTPKPLRPAAKS